MAKNRWELYQFGFMTAGVFIIHLYRQKIQPPFEIGIIRAGWIFLSVLYKKL